MQDLRRSVYSLDGHIKSKVFFGLIIGLFSVACAHHPGTLAQSYDESGEAFSRTIHQLDTILEKTEHLIQTGES